MNHNKAELIEAIALKETHLARLDAERQTLLDSLHDLRQQLTAIDVAASPAQETSTLSSTAKITLFRSLFRGREDVYPNNSCCMRQAHFDGRTADLFAPWLSPRLRSVRLAYSQAFL